MKALRTNSSSVMSLVSCSFPLSPSGFAIDACSTKVLITYFTIETTLGSPQFHIQRDVNKIRRHSPMPTEVQHIELAQDFGLHKGHLFHEILHV